LFTPDPPSHFHRIGTSADLSRIDNKIEHHLPKPPFVPQYRSSLQVTLHRIFSKLQAPEHLGNKFHQIDRFQLKFRYTRIGNKILSNTLTVTSFFIQNREFFA